MSKPRLLDLFCGAGGAAMGYSRAGFEVVGVDIKPQPRYPFEFIQADALTFPLEGFDAIHASPPCQGYSSALIGLVKSGSYPLLIPAVRQRLQSVGVPYVIENVRGAPLPSAITLCGSSFGLRVWRHRYFEVVPALLSPPCQHIGWPLNPYKAPSRRRDGIEKQAMRHYTEAMGIDWMSGVEATEAIPPAYTEWIGHQLMAHLERAA